MPRAVENRAVTPKYVIEREVPGTGSMFQKDLRDLSQTSCNVLNVMGAVTDHPIKCQINGDRIYRTYIDPNEQMIQEHAQQGFPGGQDLKGPLRNRPDHRGGLA